MVTLFVLTGFIFVITQFYYNGDFNMQIKKLAQAVIITLSIVAMSACTHTKKNSDAAMGMNNAGGSSSTSGIGEGTHYGSDSAAGSSRKVTAKNTYYFDYDRSNVRDSDKPAIYAQADYLLAHPNAKIILEGHTDPRGSREYNVGLGERRAQAVSDILKNKGVNPSQIRILSYGSERPASTGRSESEFQLDRRSIVVYIQG
jgi:peptidoglycan-associated lipoprotein